MAEFLELLESIQAEQGSTAKLFGGEGVGAKSLSRRNTPAYKQSFVEAARFMEKIMTGALHPYKLSEAMGTADFPLLFGDLLDRQVYAAYLQTPSVWKAFIKESKVSDFRTVKRYQIKGGQAPLERVQEQAEYPERGLSEATYSYSVNKYGARMSFSWEAMVNDDLGQFNDIPRILGLAARATEDRFATDLYVDANGPDATFYTVAAPNQNRLTGNPAFSITALQTAMTLLAAQRDADGNPIVLSMVNLVVPPALEVAARNLLSATQLYVGAAGDNQLITTNWMNNRMNLIVDPYIPIIASTANGNTSWFLFADPNTGGRPAAEIAFLRRHEAPEIFIKSPNATKVGGGVDPFNGSFENDSVEYKVRHVLGGTLGDPKMSVASNGSGS